MIPQKETTTTTCFETLDESEKQCQLEHLRFAACTKQLWSLTRHGSRQAAEIVARRSLVQCSRTAGLAALSRWTWTRQRELLLRRHEMPASAHISSDSNSRDDRTKLRRLNITLTSTGACQQRARIEHMCDPHVSRSRFHLCACAGCVHGSPHDFVISSATETG